MPELPEVETIARDLNQALRFKKIIAVKPLDGKVFQLSKDELRAALGRGVKSVSRRSKMITMDLAAAHLVIHLKMTGQLVYEQGIIKFAGGHPIANESKLLPNKFTRVIFYLSGGGVLYFNDVRRFGWVRLANKQQFAALLAKQGIEPLSPEFNLIFFKNFLKRKAKSTIKQALMDQKHLSGIGNIYADESLFAARLSPFRRAGDLSRAKAAKLYRTIPKILKFAIRHRGTSFSDYVDAQGEVGGF